MMIDKISVKKADLNKRHTDIVEADVFDYRTEKLFDTIYLDIWNYINEKVYREQMLPLMRKYREILVSIETNPSRWLDCWCSYEAREGGKI